MVSITPRDAARHDKSPPGWGGPPADVPLYFRAAVRTKKPLGAGGRRPIMAATGADAADSTPNSKVMAPTRMGTTVGEQLSPRGGVSRQTSPCGERPAHYAWRPQQHHIMSAAMIDTSASVLESPAPQGGSVFLSVRGRRRRVMATCRAAAAPGGGCLWLGRGVGAATLLAGGSLGLQSWWRPLRGS